MANFAATAKSHALLWQATEFDRLWEGWERVRANRGAPGGDGVTVDRFEPFAGTALKRLGQALRNGTYRPAPARRVMIPRRSGGLRPLDIPAVIDRVAQSAVALTIGPMLDARMEDSSFAYRPGRSVADAVRRVASLRRDGFRWVVDGDIERYFEMIPHGRLLDQVETCLGDDRLLDLIGHWLEWYGQHERGVPQGSPLSPLLANIYLDGVDEAIATRGLRLVRYADDFLILARDERDAHKALDRIGTLLADEGLELNPRKTRIRSFDQGFRFLGHVFARSLVMKEVDWGLPDEAAIALGEDLTRIAAEALGAEAAEDGGPANGSEASAQHSPGWRALYVLEPDRQCDAVGESVVVREAGDTGGTGGRPVLAVAARHLGRIELAKTVEATPRFLELAAAHEIVVARIDGHGETTAEWMPPAVLSLHGQRHLQQARHVLDPALRLDLAQRIVIGRLRGQRAVLSRANQAHKLADVSATLPNWRRLLLRAGAANSIPQVMGHEGAATALYWPLLSQCLRHDMGFDGKRRRKGTISPFDLVLNLLANALARDVRLALLRHGLHPGMSALHESHDGETALVYDLMEEFRAPLIEATAVAMVNRRAVTKDMFARNLAGGFGVGTDAYRAVMRGYEGALDRPIASPARGGAKVRWRLLIDDQAAALAQHFADKAPYTAIDLGY